MLDDTQLRSLIVDRTIGVHNAVTGLHLEILHGVDGRRLITAVDDETPDAEVMGELLHGRNIGHEIRAGCDNLQIAGTPLNVAVYRLGDRYIAGRSNEFGHANHEVEAEVD